MAVYGGNGNSTCSNGCSAAVSATDAGSSTSSLVKDGTTTVDNTTHAALGDQTHDTSSVSGQVGTFSLAGTVTYSLYPTNDCSEIGRASCRETVNFSVAVTASTLKAALAHGRYSYKAAYGVNGNYSGSNCGRAPVGIRDDLVTGVQMGDLPISTVDNTTHAALGDQTHDTSSVSGQVGTFSLAGTVTYSLYPTNDCS